MPVLRRANGSQVRRACGLALGSQTKGGLRSLVGIGNRMASIMEGSIPA